MVEGRSAVGIAVLRCVNLVPFSYYRTYVTGDDYLVGHRQGLECRIVQDLAEEEHLEVDIRCCRCSHIGADQDVHTEAALIVTLTPLVRTRSLFEP